jgi:putative SOS response-associated peptidase YedK
MAGGCGANGKRPYTIAWTDG